MNLHFVIPAQAGIQDVESGAARRLRCVIPAPPRRCMDIPGALHPRLRGLDGPQQETWHE